MPIFDGILDAAFHLAGKVGYAAHFQLFTQDFGDIAPLRFYAAVFLKILDVLQQFHVDFRSRSPAHFKRAA